MENLEDASLGSVEAHRTANDLTGSEREVALRRFRLLRPAIEEGVPLTKVAKERGIPLRTAQRWMAAYRREGLSGLAKRPRGDRGHCHKLPE